MAGFAGIGTIAGGLNRALQQIREQKQADLQMQMEQKQLEIEQAQEKRLENDPNAQLGTMENEYLRGLQKSNPEQFQQMMGGLINPGMAKAQAAEAAAAKERQSAITYLTQQLMSTQDPNERAQIISKIQYYASGGSSKSLFDQGLKRDPIADAAMKDAIAERYRLDAESKLGRMRTGEALTKRNALEDSERVGYMKGAAAFTPEGDPAPGSMTRGEATNLGYPILTEKDADVYRLGRSSEGQLDRLAEAGDKVLPAKPGMAATVGPLYRAGMRAYGAPEYTQFEQAKSAMIPGLRTIAGAAKVNRQELEAALSGIQNAKSAEALHAAVDEFKRQIEIEQASLPRSGRFRSSAGEGGGGSSFASSRGTGGGGRPVYDASGNVIGHVP